MAQVASCALEAIGFDLSWATAFSGSTSWKMGAAKKVFRKIASRALGPVGVGIAAVTFGYCLYKANQEPAQPTVMSVLPLGRA